VKIESRDGFSGSPVYNEKAEVVGIFSGYDWSQKVALISPATGHRNFSKTITPTRKQLSKLLTVPPAEGRHPQGPSYVRMPLVLKIPLCFQLLTLRSNLL
jgi:hypothetical protein